MSRPSRPISQGLHPARRRRILLLSLRLGGTTHGIPLLCDLPGEPPDDCRDRKDIFRQLLNEDLHAPNESQNLDIAFDAIEQPGGEPDLLVLEYTAPPERAGSLVQPTDEALGERVSLRALAGWMYLPEQAGEGRRLTSPTLVLVNTEFGLQAYPALVDMIPQGWKMWEAQPWRSEAPTGPPCSTWTRSRDSVTTS